MLFDLHCHTFRSFDAFTSDSEILSQCIERGVNAIAITEHDLDCEVDKAVFHQNGIELISGCEFTDNNGAHIIGLFVSGSLPIGSNAGDIIRYVKSQNGLLVMPHPWKPGSGFMATTCARELLPSFDFIELINGGWDSSPFYDDIVILAEKYNLRMIASSDSHKADQVGLCCTEIEKRDACDNARDLLTSCIQSDIKLMIDHSVHKKSRKTFLAKFRQMSLYQTLLKACPYSVRRFLKNLVYSMWPFNGSYLPIVREHHPIMLRKND